MADEIDQMDCVIGYTRIFTEMAETYLDLLMSTTQSMHQTILVDILLDCMALSDVESA